MCLCACLPEAAFVLDICVHMCNHGAEHFIVVGRVTDSPETAQQKELLMRFVTEQPEVSLSS